MNRRIKVPQIRLIDHTGAMQGLFSTEAAVKMAEEEGLDLVEVDPNAKPPVCKIMDYGKHKYQLQKKQHESKKKQIVVHVKEIKMRPNIDEHDIAFKLNHIRRFLEGKDKAKVTMQFRGREMQHIDRGRDVMERIIKEVEDIGKVEAQPKMEGRSLSMILVPSK